MLRELLTIKYHNYRFFAHNLGGYDGLLILPLLLKLVGDNLKILKARDGEILKITVNMKKAKFHFQDSLRLLPSNLEQLALSWETPTVKGKFPYRFVNANNLDYVGPPPLEYYDCDEKPEMISNWDLKNESVTYLNHDLVSLSEV